ncbi:MAG TPA: hypothetical protein VM925_13460 [Labilithrix sp.]|nr:hypothetical protein [Labilithrix sp.]
MRLRTRIGIALVVAACVALLARNAIAQMLVGFHSPHVVRVPGAVIDSALAERLDAEARAATLATPGELVTFALRSTAKELHFGLSHHTRLWFDGVEREGNCVEYAALFASIINREHGSVDAHAWVVRSDASILGQTVPHRAWKDHDWVLVVVNGNERMYVDPTLYDMGLGWDISRAVRGTVPVPSSPLKR